MGSTVGATEAVITVRGLCNPGVDKNAKDAGSCTQVISREQFETPGGGSESTGPSHFSDGQAERGKDLRGAVGC